MRVNYDNVNVIVPFYFKKTTVIKQDMLLSVYLFVGLLMEGACFRFGERNVTT